MSVEAVRAYFERLTDLQGLKVGVVAERAGVKPGYVSRLHAKDIKDPSARILRALTTVVGGSWDDVGALLDPKATTQHAEVLADAWYARIMQINAESREVLRRRLLTAADELLEDQVELRQVLRRAQHEL